MNILTIENQFMKT